MPDAFTHASTAANCVPNTVGSPADVEDTTRRKRTLALWAASTALATSAARSCTVAHTQNCGKNTV